jgi:hypothetical protein
MGADSTGDSTKTPGKHPSPASQSPRTKPVDKDFSLRAPIRQADTPCLVVLIDPLSGKIFHRPDWAASQSLPPKATTIFVLYDYDSNTSLPFPLEIARQLPSQEAFKEAVSRASAGCRPKLHRLDNECSRTPSRITSTRKRSPINQSHPESIVPIQQNEPSP